MSGIVIQERAAGCLVGLACGDALGGPVEFRSPSDIARAFADGLKDFVGGGWLSLAPGEVTDDTQMTLALARALDHDEPTMESVGIEFLNWYRTKPKDIGNTTRAALEQLAAGRPWNQAGDVVQQAAGRRGAAGNGAVMRCAPVALRYWQDSEQLIQSSRDTSRITHADTRCQWGAVAVNQGIVHLLTGGAVEDLPEAAIVDIDEPAVRDAVLTATRRDRSELRAGGYVLDTLTAAFWSVVRFPTFDDAVVAAVSLGNDADTTGAVTGALAGAAHGLNAIPTRWRDQVQYRDDLERLAAALLGRASASREL